MVLLCLQFQGELSERVSLTEQQVAAPKINATEPKVTTSVSGVKEPESRQVTTHLYDAEKEPTKRQQMQSESQVIIF